MYISDVDFQTRVLMFSIGFGTLLGVLYDIFRLVRLALTDKKSGIFAQDFIFISVSTFLTFIFLLVVNNGRLRFYIFSAIVIGFFAYYLTLGTLTVRLGGVLIKTVRRVIGAVASIICVPFRIIFRLSSKIKLKICPIFAKRLKFFVNYLKTLLKKN